jgi:hypothetical protein
MRVFLGMILGVFLTIGIAYVSDSGRQQVCAAGADKCPIVNWGEANVRMRNVSGAVQEAWNHLTGHEKG